MKTKTYTVVSINDLLDGLSTEFVNCVRNELSNTSDIDWGENYDTIVDLFTMRMLIDDAHCKTGDSFPDDFQLISQRLDEVEKAKWLIGMDN